ncbi:hypothetical protein EVAR_26034_1 [Eumeta japonica]|uniref:Uncharacterized protein n=1 Tax=Eumeta variegata TaxID=151549 RepID=A0A4C1VQL6_EUMVA|nr:hypothetical protein EVAR_26034_1 [Eumeta japonica]
MRDEVQIKSFVTSNPKYENENSGGARRRRPPTASRLKGPRKQKSFAYKLLKRGLANLMSPTSTSGVAPPLCNTAEQRHLSTQTCAASASPHAAVNNCLSRVAENNGVYAGNGHKPTPCHGDRHFLNNVIVFWSDFIFNVIYISNLELDGCGQRPGCCPHMLYIDLSTMIDRVDFGPGPAFDSDSGLDPDPSSDFDEIITGEPIF